ncbi:NfeD family protein [Sphingobacterium psychroaquaticum]|uniref:Membrane-bound serine protease (ClpP class) n=1 Tax=Sphingobacterium psychroaquaticum TaxID=561061 RepID=A0A1X7JKF9_9SPHI|nr:NfeD family protein [Sphingobacterium psychroaquaticum]QBQ40754.1 nodulation protein NfeD [Sphingobacterium psychroaquaticum]SMG28409.1 membrane-bound serine protease (ClpP class) [Sphingobacterium psychroaquaticum]
MNKSTKTFLAFLFLWVACMQVSMAQRVYKVDVKDDIGPNAWRTINLAYKKAEETKAKIFLVELNTFGGAVNFADSIRTRLLSADMKTIVYVNNNAASAGTLISLAADKIYMQKGGSLGAASVVNQQGEIMPEKYQSYMRGLMRATAEAKGRDVHIAEAFVDPEVSVPALKPDGKLLTLTTSEAVKAGVADAEVTSITDLYTKAEIKPSEVSQHKITTIDRIIAFLINPMVSGFLILGIIGGIYFELQTPGIGFALFIALLCGALFFAPLYLQGLADHWEIAIFVIGVVLLALEIFVIPGFGVAGVLGIIFVLCGLAFSMVDNDFLDFKLTRPGLLMNSFLIVIGAMLGAVVLMVAFGRNLMKSSLFKRLVLEDEQKAEVGYTSSQQMVDLIGKQGVARTVLRPAGKVEIEGRWYDVVALDGFVDVGELVSVEKHENYNLFVRKLEDKAI